MKRKRLRFREGVRVALGNARSQAAMKKLGAVREGVLRSHIKEIHKTEPHILILLNHF